MGKDIGKWKRKRDFIASSCNFPTFLALFIGKGNEIVSYTSPGPIGSKRKSNTLPRMTLPTVEKTEKTKAEHQIPKIVNHTRRDFSILPHTNIST